MRANKPANGEPPPEPRARYSERDLAAWLASFRPEQGQSMLQEQPVIARRLDWLTVHGALCLALRHPAFTGPSRGIILQFVEQLGAGLVEWGVLTPDQLRIVHQVESEESPHGH